MTALDLPIARQRALAQMMGKSLEQWRSDTAANLAEAAAFAAECDAGERPPEADDAAIDQFQARIDSAGGGEVFER